MNLSIITLAAGKGTRMRAGNVEMNIRYDLPKVCQLVNNKPMIEMVIETAYKLNPDQVVVVVSANNKLEISNHLKNYDVIYCTQNNISGTASAVLSSEHIYKNNNILVLLGDVPFIKTSTLSNVMNNDFDCVIVGFTEYNNNNMFGRILLNNNNKIIKIIEYNEASENEKQITEVNSGMLYLRSHCLNYLHKINNNNSKNEYYLTDIVEILNKNNFNVGYLRASKRECFGINNHRDLTVAHMFNN